jgi:hypothetical protein
MNVVLTVLVAGATFAAPEARPVGVKVTHGHLRPVCMDGAPVRPGDRSWRLAPGSHSMVLTMRNAPRPGIADAPAGFAAVTFTLEDGHQYEVEVRAPATAFSNRVWARGEWKPVVRDRTADRLVSGEAQWSESAACAP